MRYGLLFLSLAMLTGGGVAAQSALAISDSASAAVPEDARPASERSGSYGSIPFTAPRVQTMR